MRGTAASVGSLVRPPFAVLMGLFLSLGLVQGSPRPSSAVQGLLCLAVGGWMLCSVALNDLADVDVDRVNLPGDHGRRHAAGEVSSEQLLVLAAVSGAVSLAAAVALGAVATTVVVAGLLLSAAYSLPPFRLSARGVLTSLLLPFAYVAVPFLLGASAWVPDLPGRSWALLAGLYLGFVGRLALKDFRDQRGDRLYGKRTLLVRHGRVRTCAFSATFLLAGGVLTLIALPARSPVLWVAGALEIIVALLLLRLVAADTHGKCDRANIAAFAMVGRWFVVLCLAQSWAFAVGWSTTSTAALVVLAAAVGLVLTARIRRLTLPTRSGSRAELDAFAPPRAQVGSDH